MKKFIVALVLLITLAAVPNSEALPGGFCCKTFAHVERAPAATSDDIPSSTIPGSAIPSSDIPTSAI